MITKINCAIKLQELFYLNMHKLMYYQSLLNENTPFLAHEDIEDLMDQKQRFCNSIKEKLNFFEKTGLQVNVPRTKYLKKFDFKNEKFSLNEIYAHLASIEKELINSYVEAMSTMNTEGLVFKSLMEDIKIMKTNLDYLNESKINPRILQTA